jgi:glycosyltransferase involved in cell wall biosynthesis
MNQLVSVIITTYDRPHLLNRAIQSVVDQTYKNLEIIIIDGGCSEATVEVVNSFNDKRITYVCYKDSDSMMGYGQVQRCRNFGLTLAKGKYVAMLDDDDFWRPDKIEQQLFYAERHDAALVSCYTEVYGSGHIDKPNLIPTYEDLLRNFNMSCTSSYFLNREVLSAIGNFNTSLRSMHEYDIALKLAKRKHKIIIVPEPLMIIVQDNAKQRKFYYIKIAEVFDLYRLYGRDMLTYLGAKGFIFNVIKSLLLITLFLMGFLVKEKIWGIIYKLKNMYQET